MSNSSRTQHRDVIVGERRGFALLTIIILTLGMAALAASAVYLSGSASLLNTSLDREREFKYGAEAAMAMGKSRLNTDPLALPDSLFTTLISGQPVVGADGVALPGVTVNLYAGPTGSSTGQFGRFASVVAEARDGQGARFVRRLELTQESFARFAYWSNRETNNGNTIYFANGDNLWGPVWSNDNISIASSGAWFHNEVGTAKTISGKPYGTFSRGYSENQPVITLPSSSLAKLPGYAAAGNMNFITPNSGNAASVLARVEFVATDLGGPTDSTGIDEGFLKVYVANAGETSWLRGDWTNNKATTNNCGAAYSVVPGGPKLFFPASVHNINNAWFTALLRAGGMTAQQATNAANASLGDIMALPTARCYLGGDPHLVAIERNNANFGNAQKQIGGDETTFTPVGGAKGRWLQWPGPIDPRLAARRPWDAQYLFPIYRGLNPGTKGVVSFTGTIGLSGVLRGRTTIYSTGSVIILDDMRYATDPSAATDKVGKCPDILGIIATDNITLADNAILGPEFIQPANGNGFWKNFDDTKDVYLHGVMMALNTSFGAENYDQGPNNANGCEGNQSGRGCLYLYGGLIQENRGPVGLVSGNGYVKRYTYDHCAVTSPPPYFPTTGRFLDNRYYEIDPVRFNVTQLFASLQPGP
jgi:hypothetical protein